MVLVFLSLLLLVAGYFLSRCGDRNRTVGRPLMGVGILMFVIGLIVSTFVQIDAGYVGVQKLYGSVQKDVLYSGLHMINPLLEVEQIETRTQNYTMSGVHDEGDKSGDDAIRVLSADGLEVTIDLTVLFRVMPATAPDLYKQTGPEYVNKIVRPISRTKIRDNAVYYDAVSLYSSKRDEFQARIYKALENDF